MRASSKEKKETNVWTVLCWILYIFYLSQHTTTPQGIDFCIRILCIASDRVRMKTMEVEGLM